MNLMAWFDRSSDASTDQLLDRQINILTQVVEDLRHERDNYRAEARYWKDKFMAVMGLGDMSYPGGLMGGPAQEVLEEPAEPSHVSLISLRARHEFESKRRAMEMEKGYTSPSIEGKRENS